MTTVTTTKAKEKFTSMVRKAHNLGERYVITHRGEKYGVLVSADEFEGMLETIDILKNKKLISGIVKSLKELKQGKTLPFKEVVGRRQKK